LTTWLALLLATTAPSMAQDAPPPELPPEDEPAEALVFNYDELLVTTVQPEAPATEADADRVHALIRGRFAQNNTMLAMADQPVFEVQGYDAQQYLRSCPDGQYADCALVVGQRGNASWVVGATVGKVADEFDPSVQQDRVTVHFVDVPNATVVATFSVVLDGTNDAAIIDGIARAYDRMVQGEYDARDVRGDLGDPEAEAALQKARAERIAASLAEMEEQLGDVIRGEVVRGEKKVTKEDLDAYDSREEKAPWERVGMSKGEYLRFANSGKDLATWRREANGRFGQVLVRAGFGGGAGPYSQGYESAVLLSGTTLQPIHTAQVSEVRRGGTGIVDLELGVGVAPWVELMFAMGFRTGQVTLVNAQYKQGDVFLDPKESTQALNTSQLGVRAAFVPGNHWIARPTLGLGFAAWSGVGVEGSNANLDPLDKPKATFFEILPGAELSASKTVNLFVRGLVALPVGAAKAQTDEQGGDYQTATTGVYDDDEARLPYVPGAGSDPGLSISAQVGLTLRFGPLWKVSTKVDSRIEDDEPDF